MKKRLLAFFLVFVMSAGLFTAMSQREQAEAAIAFLYDSKKPEAILTKKKGKEIFVGGKSVHLGYNIGGIKKGVKGKWISSKPSVVKVSKSGKLTAVGNGTAFITFKYKTNKKEIKISAKVISRTRATEISLKPQGDFNGTMSFEGGNVFEAKMETNPKALKINPSITHNYKVFYELFMDSELKNPAPSSLAKISESGVFTAGNEPGTVYLRAAGKLSKNSKNGVIYSEPIAITIGPKLDLKEALISQTALNQFKVSFEQAEKITGIEIREFENNLEVPNTMSLTEDRKTLIVTTTRNLTKIAKVTLKAGDKKEEKVISFEAQKVAKIELIGEEAALVKFDNNKGRAEIGFRFLDQFGNDVTFDKRFANKSFATWENNTRADVGEDGRIGFDLSTEQSAVGYKGKLKVNYVGREQTEVEEEFPVKIGNFRIPKDLKIDGIYKKLTSGYVKVMDRNGSIPVGSVMGNHNVPLPNDAFPPYYLLIKVKDNTGVSMAEAGATLKKYMVKITSGTGLDLDKLTNNEIKSVEPAIIGGERFMTYPLKPVVLKEGDVIIQAEIPGTRLTDIISGKVSGSTSITSGFAVSGEGYVNEDNLIQFDLKNSNDERVTKYEDVISSLGLSDNGFGIVYLVQSNNLIQSEKGSVFYFKKNKGSGEAELYYRPTILSIKEGVNKDVEEVIVMKGTPNEKKCLLYTKRK